MRQHKKKKRGIRLFKKEGERLEDRPIDWEDDEADNEPRFWQMQMTVKDVILVVYERGPKRAANKAIAEWQEQIAVQGLGRFMTGIEPTRINEDNLPGHIRDVMKSRFEKEQEEGKG